MYEKINVEELDMDIISSPLSKAIEIDGESLEVEIYGSEDSEWFLEVVNSNNTSHVWNDSFPTHEAAFQEFQRTIKEEGVEVFAAGILDGLE